MKKTYMKPQTEAMEMDLQGMIAESDPKYGGGYGGGGTSDAPMMPDLEDDDLDFLNPFDFPGTNVKLF